MNRNFKIAFLCAVFIAVGIFSGVQNLNAAHNTFIVDANHSNKSDTGPGTESLPFATPQGCINRMHGGDRCLIKNGTYVGVGPNDGEPRWNFCACVNNCNGTENNPTVIKAFPGHSPKFCATADCNQATAGSAYLRFPIGGSSSQTCEWLAFDGLHVDSNMEFAGAGTPPYSVRHIEVRNSTFEGGGDDSTSGSLSTCDTNAHLLRFERVSDARIHHNLFHRMNTGSNNPCNSETRHVLTFCVADVLVEYNTFDSTQDIGGNHYDAWDQHQGNARGLVMRYNRMKGRGKVSFENDNFTPPGDCAGLPWPMTDLRVYGNVASGFGFNPLLGGIAFANAANILVHHNTLVDSAEPLVMRFGPVSNVTVRDNIVHNPVDSQIGTPANVVIGSGVTASLPDMHFDYNRYDSDANYEYAVYSVSPKTTLAAWQTTLGGCPGNGNDCNSTEAQTACLFASTVDYKLVPGSACTTLSSTGGEVGAYGITNCVGHTCGGSATPVDTTPPAAPQGVVIL